MTAQTDEATPKSYGWPIISLAAMLWGSDMLLRPMVQRAGFSSALIVLIEHIALVTIFLVPLYKYHAEWRKLDRKQWLSLAFLGIFGSGLATVLLTQAYMDGSPYMTGLLQKTQPIFTIILAGIFLKERRKPVFWLFYAGAIVATYFLAFGFDGIGDAFNSPKLLPVCKALGAAAIWGTCTVVGRAISNDVPPPALAGLRFAFAIPFLVVLFLLQKPSEGAPLQWSAAALPMLLIILLPDALGMFLYYIGLKKTPASIATLAELAFPLTALFIGMAFQNAKMSPGQWLGLVLLLVCLQIIQNTKSVQILPQTTASNSA